MRMNKLWTHVIEAGLHLWRALQQTTYSFLLLQLLSELYFCGRGIYEEIIELPNMSSLIQNGPDWLSYHGSHS